MSSPHAPQTTISQPPFLLLHNIVDRQPDYMSGPQPLIFDPSEWGCSGPTMHLGAYGWDWESERIDQLYTIEPHGANSQRSHLSLDRIVRNMREQLEDQCSPAKKSRLEKMRSDLRDFDLAVHITYYKASKAMRRRSQRFWRTKP